MGSAGGFAVGCELVRHLAAVRPGWTLTLQLISGHPLHEWLRASPPPRNVRLAWAPAEVARLWPRRRYEGHDLIDRARCEGVNAVVQLNGTTIPGMPVPTFAHFQDPWPNVPQAWNRLSERVVAAGKRLQQSRGLRQAARQTAATAFDYRVHTGRICRFIEEIAYGYAA